MPVAIGQHVPWIAARIAAMRDLPVQACGQAHGSLTMGQATGAVAGVLALSGAALQDAWTTRRPATARLDATGSGGGRL